MPSNAAVAKAVSAGQRRNRSSLVPIPTIGPSEDGFGGVENRCPRKPGYRLRNVETGELRPARCGAHKCAWCGPINARFVAKATAAQCPERMVTLTQVGDDWQVRRARLKRFRYCVEKELGCRMQWCWHCEPNPKETGHHVHGWQKGDFLPQKALSRLADSCGMGRVVDVRKWESQGTAGIDYGMKLVGIDYGLKLAAAESMMGEYLAANGGRLVHHSRGFFPDGLQAAVAAVAGESDGEWVFERGECL